MTATRPSSERSVSKRLILSRAARVLLVPYLIALALIVWLPAPEASTVTGVVFEIAHEVSRLSGMTVEISYAIFEFVANIVLFVPLGLLLSLSWPGAGLWTIVLLGCSTSATIELVQLLLPSRVTALSDVIANTLGTAAGALTAGMIIGLGRRERRRWRAAPAVRRAASPGSSVDGSSTRCAHHLPDRANPVRECRAAKVQ